MGNRSSATPSDSCLRDQGLAVTVTYADCDRNAVAVNFASPAFGARLVTCGVMLGCRLGRPQCWSDIHRDAQLCPEAGRADLRVFLELRLRYRQTLLPRACVRLSAG